MSYRNMDTIKSCLDPINFKFGFERWEEANEELESVYAKANLYDENKARIEAWERIEIVFERIRIHGGITPFSNTEEFGYEVAKILMNYESEQEE